MRTRNADNPKSPPPAKRTPPVRKFATKTPPTPVVADQQSPSESTGTPKRAPSTRGKAVATNDGTTTSIIPAEAVKVDDDTIKVTPGTKSGNKRTVKRVIKRTVSRAKPKSTGVPAEQESLNEVKDAAHVKQEESSPDDVNDAGMSLEYDKDAVKVEDAMKDVEDDTDVQPSVEDDTDFQPVEDVEGSLRLESADHHEPEVCEKDDMETENKVLEFQEPTLEKKADKENNETDDEEPFEIEEPDTLDTDMNVEIKQVPTEVNEDKVEHNESVDMEKGTNEEFKEEDPQERLCFSDEEKDKDISNDDEDELGDMKMEENDELRFQEHEEFTEAAEERKRRKEFEVFVGGLDRDATEEEVKKVFQNAGEVVEVRMHKELPINRNRGYAFVRFANKEQVVRALTEMKNPVIHGKRCGTAPSEDNDTLFLGNICNTWTKEAIKQKLKDYGIEGVERITLVPDPQQEGLSRGFAFLEFSGRPDAILAFRRLQKPDAIFGLPDRTAKVGFAEPLREPDPEVLAQVKSVFVDGLPPHWEEDIVRDHLKTYGTIERVMLARNMSTAKRKDFGFVDFTTHESALACIDGINKSQLGDDKVIVKARLSNPLPKTPAVKGEVAGGFRIDHGSGATFSTTGRGFGRSAHPSERGNIHRGRGFYHHRPGQSQTREMGFAEDYPPPPFRGIHSFGGRWDNFRGPHQPYGQGYVSPRYDVDRPRHGANMHRDYFMPMRGHPYMPEEQFSRPYGGRPYEDPYAYEDTSHGMKRPYFAEPDSDYTEPSRGRPRLDYSDPAYSVPGARYRGGGSGGPSRDYYNYDYSSSYGGDRSYGTGPYGGEPYDSDRFYGGERPYHRPFGGRYHY